MAARRPGNHLRGSPPARRVIALAKSADGTAFSPPAIVLAQGDCYPPALGFDGYSTPSAATDGIRIHLFCDVGYFSPTAERKWSQVAIHHAVSGNRRSLRRCPARLPPE